jgi:hypothetical protein
MLRWFCICSTTRCLGMNLAETRPVPTFFKIVEHDHKKITISSATFHIVSHKCAFIKAMNEMIFFLTISNADGQVIMMVIFLQFLATLNLQPLCILHIQDMHTATTVHPIHIRQAKSYHCPSYTKRTGIELPSRITFYIFFRQAAQSLLFSSQNAVYFMMSYFWFTKYSHKKW